MLDNKIKIGISMGDFNGVGPEVIMKSLSDSRILDKITAVIYGSTKVFLYYKKLYGLSQFSFQIAQNISHVDKNRINIINCVQPEENVVPGKSTREAGRCAFESLEAAVADLKSGAIDALVTAPINKKNIQSEHFSFPGHTEYLQQVFDGDEVLMFMVSDSLKIGTVTGHIPLEDVPKSLTTENICHKIELIAKSLHEDFGITSPKIAILSLNPHAGDSGLLGSEEENIIIPAIKEMKQRGILAFGPYPSDGFFGSDLCAKFDAVLSMYHDQGLTPFKALTFDKGVNFTAGLQVVRTSPDHGTAYDIAGNNKADCGSFRSAIYFASDILRKRTEYEELYKNRMV